MQSSGENRMMRVGLTAVVCAMVFASGCTLADQSAPPLAGPSGLGLSMAVTASPEILPRDGSSTSVISIHANYPDRPFKGRLLLSASAGTVSATEVSTTDGNAAFVYTAPGLNESVSTVTVVVTPVENGDLANNTPRSVRIAVMGPDVPVASFTFIPSSPTLGETVTFDGSGSRLGGVPCGASCTYQWNFGDGSSATGLAVQHAFTSVGAQNVTLTVNGPAGTSNSVTRVVIVAPPALPVADFTATPTGPAVGVTVTFTSTSTVGTGATIVRHVWDFDNGAPPTDTGATAAAALTGGYATSGPKSVTLTITDSLGRQSARTRIIIVP
jgi:PKD repeat protein